MGGVDGKIVRQDEDLVAERPEELAGEVVARCRAEEVGPADRSDHERTTAEQRGRLSALTEEVRKVVRCVSRGRDRAQHHVVSELNLVAGRDVAVPNLEVSTLRGEKRRTSCRKFGTAGDIVRVRVRIGGEREFEAARTRRGTVILGQAGWVDDQRAAVAQVDEIRRVTEALVDERDDVDHRRGPVVAHEASALSDSGISCRRSWRPRTLTKSTLRQNVAGCSPSDTVTAHPPGAWSTCQVQSA